MPTRIDPDTGLCRECGGGLTCMHCHPVDRPSQAARIAELETHMREAAREKALLEYERWSALQHIAQLLMGREPAEVAWWLQKNHAAFFCECAPNVRTKIGEMAAAAD